MGKGNRQKGLKDDVSKGPSIESKKNNSVNSCIFCEKSNLTKEHLFPDWLQKFIPRTDKHVRHLVRRTFRDEATGKENSIISRGKLHRPGDAMSQTLRVVCADCNNGWMSRLQILAKPIVIPLITDDWHKIDRDSQTVLAAWITMIVIVAEYADLMTVAITPEQRREFMNSRLPLDASIISIGTFKGKARANFHHFSTVFFRKNSPPKDLHQANVQMTTITIGNLIFQMFSHTSTGNFPKFFTERYFEHFGLQKIWPISSESLTHPIKITTDEDFHSVAETMRNFFLTPMQDQTKMLFGSKIFSITQMGDVADLHEPEIAFKGIIKHLFSRFNPFRTVKKPSKTP